MSFIKSIKKSGSKINLYKLDKDILAKQTKGTTLFSNGINICVLDLETTGLNMEEDKIIEIKAKVTSVSPLQVMGPIGMEEMTTNIQDMISNIMPKKSKSQKLKVSEAREVLIQDESEKLIEMDDVIPDYDNRGYIDDIYCLNIALSKQTAIVKEKIEKSVSALRKKDEARVI